MIDIDTMLQQGWQFVDASWRSAEKYENLMKALTDAGGMVLASSSNLAEDTHRGQLLVPPEAVEKIRATL